jgi:hypothetical protein
MNVPSRDVRALQPLTLAAAGLRSTLAAAGFSTLAAAGLRSTLAGRRIHDR